MKNSLPPVPLYCHNLVFFTASAFLSEISPRTAHVQHIDAAALGQRARLQHQLGRLGNGHKVALDVGVGQGDGAALLDLSLEQRDHAAVAAQHVAKADRHALHVGVARKGLDEHLTDPLGAAHHAGGIDRLVGGKLDEPLHVVLAGAGEQVLGAQHVVLHGLGSQAGKKENNVCSTSANSAMRSVRELWSDCPDRLWNR